jgi:hypothetical protein
MFGIGANRCILHPSAPEDPCADSTNHMMIGKENYFRSHDGFAAPAKQDQTPPDRGYSRQTRK